MDTRVASAIARRIAELEALSDEDLVTQWTAVGRRLAAEEPDEFRTVYKATLTKLADPTELEPTVDNWAQFGGRLVQMGPQLRGVMVKVTALNAIRLDELEAERRKA